MSTNQIILGSVTAGGLVMSDNVLGKAESKTVGERVEEESKKEIKKEPLKYIVVARQEYTKRKENWFNMMSVIKNHPGCEKTLNKEFWEIFFNDNGLVYPPLSDAQSSAWEFAVQMIMKRFECGEKDMYIYTTVQWYQNFLSEFKKKGTLEFTPVDLSHFLTYLKNTNKSLLLHIFTFGGCVFEIPLNTVTFTNVGDVICDKVVIEINATRILVLSNNSLLFYFDLTNEQMYQFLCAHLGVTLLF